MSVVHYNSGIFYAWIDGVLTTIPIGGGSSPSNQGLNSPLALDGLDESYEPILYGLNNPNLDNVAYTNRANVFSQNQQVTKTRPELSVLRPGRTAKFRIGQHIDDNGYFSQNISYDGTNWNLDDTGNAGVVMVFDTGGNVSLMRASAGANPRTLVTNFGFNGNGGITFPATQLAHADPNTLDDYEEGSWTPVDASGDGLTFVNSGSNYIKIGQFVMAAFHITYPTITSAAIASIGGFPFTVSNLGGNPYTSPIGFNTSAVAFVWIPISNAAYALSRSFPGAAASISNTTLSNTTHTGAFLYRAAA